MLTLFGLSIFIGAIPLTLKLLDLAPPNGTLATSVLLCADLFFAATLGVMGYIIISSMIADVVEDVAVRTGKRSEGLLFAANGLLPKLSAGETRNFNISVEMPNAGTTPISAQVLWHGPTQTDEVTTEFLGAVALHLQLQQSNNPVRVGEKVRYTLTVTNNGSAPAKGVRLIVTFPVSQLTADADGTDGKQQPDRSLVIEISQIAPKEKLVRQVTLKATAQGSAKFHVEMESAEHLPAGNVTKEEITTITE